MKKVIMTLAMSLVPSMVLAATDSKDIAISGSVSKNCKIKSTTAVAFEAYDPVDANATADLDATGTIILSCTKGSTGVTVALDLGDHASGATRRLSNGSGTLNYELYTSAAHSTVWGQSTPNLVSYSPTSKADYTMTVYGRIAGGQDADVGTGYSDTVTATVNF